MIDQAARLRQLVENSGNAHTNTSNAASGAKLPSSAHVIAVTSGKGGVGKTTLVANLAFILSEMNAKVLVVDADLGLANVDVMLGLDPGRHIGHLMMTNSTPRDVAVEGPRGMMVISGGAGLRELADAGSEDRAELIGKLVGYFAEFDYVLIDTSPGISSSVTDFLEIADDVLLVTTPEPTSIRDSYAALKTIVAKIPNGFVTPVVTSATEVSAKQAISALNHVTSKFLGREWSSWRMIDSDPLVGRTIQARKLLMNVYPKSPAAIALCKLAKFIMARKEEVGRIAPRGGNEFVLGKI